jgi:acetate kinase
MFALRIFHRRYSNARVFVINAGSSSLKYGLFDVRDGGRLAPVCSGLAEKIGLVGSAVTHLHQESGATRKIECDIADHTAALNKVVDILTGSGGSLTNVEDIRVVGHRVVHGGAELTAPTVVDQRVEESIQRCVPLAPLHNPANLQGIRVARAIFSAPHVAVFDTAFHSDMPPESYMYALPRELLDQGVRRYGFHGTSYTYVLGRAAEVLGKPRDQVSAIICHLGSGCSMAAVRNGRCVDTTMGLTPLEGLVMARGPGILTPASSAFSSTIWATRPSASMNFSTRSLVCSVSLGHPTFSRSTRLVPRAMRAPSSPAGSSSNGSGSTSGLTW